MPKKNDWSQSPYAKRRANFSEPGNFDRPQSTFIDILKLLFDPTGRVSRGTYWIWLVVSIGLGFILKYVRGFVLMLFYGKQITALLGVAQQSPTHKAHLPLNILIAICVISFVCGIPLFWMNLVMFVKRIHDSNGKPWLRILILFIPILGLLWVLYELYIKEGDQGVNNYGSEPRF